jgi:hypothetical protein
MPKPARKLNVKRKNCPQFQTSICSIFFDVAKPAVEFCGLEWIHITLNNIKYTGMLSESRGQRSYGTQRIK